jgi:hypothetical protein
LTVDCGCSVGPPPVTATVDLAPLVDCAAAPALSTLRVRHGFVGNKR